MGSFYKGFIGLIDIRSSHPALIDKQTKERITDKDQLKQIAKRPKWAMTTTENGNKVLHPDHVKITEAEMQAEAGYAGILAENAVEIDIDEMQEAEAVFKFITESKIHCQIRKTARGYHFLFRQPTDKKISTYTHKTVGLGVTCDCKTGIAKNGGSAVCLEVIKSSYEGQVRPIVYDEQDRHGDYDTVPFYFWPIDSKQKCVGLKNGDGRNACMIIVAQMVASGYTPTEARIAAKIINEHIFAEPMSADELETATRDEVIEKGIAKRTTTTENAVIYQSEHPDFCIYEPTGNGGKKKVGYDYDGLVRYAIELFHIKKIDGIMHIYWKGVYQYESIYFLAAIHEIDPRLKDSERRELLTRFEFATLDAANYSDKSTEYLMFENGLLRLSDMQLIDPTPEIVVRNRIPWEWKPDQDAEIKDAVEKEMELLAPDPNTRLLLEEAVGVALLTDTHYKKSFLLYGSGNNGKTVYLSLVERAIGHDNCSGLELKELAETAKMASLEGKLANIGDDISSDYISGANAAAFKRLVNGSKVSIKHLYQDPKLVELYCTFFFSCNERPRIHDKSGAVLERIKCIPFRGQFSPNCEYSYLRELLKKPEAVQYFLYVCVEALKGVLQRGDLTVSEEVEQESEEYRIENDPLAEFYELYEYGDIHLKPCPQVYGWYEEWAEENGKSRYKMDERSFRKEIKKHYNLFQTQRRWNGKRTYYYVNQNEVPEGQK